MKTPAIVAIALASALFGAALTGWLGHTGEVRASETEMLTNLGYGGPAAVPLGDIAGGVAAGGALAMRNPLADDADAIEEGHQLYMAMNCAGCHGYTGGGGMGPPLNDAYWRYGGAPVQIYKSLYEGRPQGMPAWGHALPAEKLWAIAAFVASLGGGVTPARAYEARLGNDIAGAKSGSGAGDEGQ